MISLSLSLGIISIVGVILAKPILLQFNPTKFVQLELLVVAFSAFRLLYMGIY